MIKGDRAIILDEGYQCWGWCSVAPIKDISLEFTEEEIFKKQKRYYFKFYVRDELYNNGYPYYLYDNQFLELNTKNPDDWL